MVFEVLDFFQKKGLKCKPEYSWGCPILGARVLWSSHLVKACRISADRARQAGKALSWAVRDCGRCRQASLHGEHKR